MVISAAQSEPSPSLIRCVPLFDGSAVILAIYEQPIQKATALICSLSGSTYAATYFPMSGWHVPRRAMNWLGVLNDIL
jgi:hypothetical protein